MLDSFNLTPKFKMIPDYSRTPSHSQINCTMVDPSAGDNREGAMALILPIRASEKLAKEEGKRVHKEVRNRIKEYCCSCTCQRRSGRDAQCEDGGHDSCSTCMVGERA